MAAGKARPVTDAAAIETVAGNYEQCRTCFEKLKGWQSFWETVKAAE
jgi:hypothetical protein